MNKDFQEAIELRLSQNYGPSRFATFMFKNLSSWEDISMEELTELIVKFKYHGGAIYALSPFVYDYLNIDVYVLYKKLANENDWEPEKVKVQVDFFNTHTLQISDKHARLDTFEVSDRRLQEISARLIGQGAPPRPIV